MKNLKKGFTLIELLVVIAILGIVVAITIVAIGGSTSKAKVNSTKKSLNSLSSAVAICCSSGMLNNVSGSGISIGGGIMGGEDLCVPSVNNLKFPIAKNLNAKSVDYFVNQNCSGNGPILEIRLQGHVKTECNYDAISGNSSAWFIYENKITAPNGC